FRAETPIGIRCWSEHQHRVGHGVRESADRMAQGLVGLEAVGCEFVAAVVPQEADVNVRATAGLIRVRLCHERSMQTVFEKDTPDDALQADYVIACEAWIGHVTQIHLVLPRPAFGEHARCGYVLDLAGTTDFRQYRGQLLDACHRVDLLPGAPHGFARRRGGPDAAVTGPTRIDDVELYFESHYRPQSKLRESPGHLLEHVTRIAKEGRSIMIGHADLDLCNPLVHPGSADE